MARIGDTTQWVQTLPTGTLFTSADAPGTPRGAASALSRLAEDDGPLMRVRSGVYWVKPAATRYGVGLPNALDVALTVAGPGAGLAAHSAVNGLGLSTQVPHTKQVAVVGRAPKGVDRVDFVTRSNTWRATLSPTEIAALEVMRATPAVLHASWPAAAARIRSLGTDGHIDLNRLVVAARHEHNRFVQQRLADLEAA